MAYPKNTKSALLALAAAGGAWAWQNRHKLGQMVGQMSSQLQSQMAQQQSYRKPAPAQQHAPAVEAYTGNTQRIGDEANEI